MPFSTCKLPRGTTRLELVTSGRSVAISSAPLGQFWLAEASAAPQPSVASASATAIRNDGASARLACGMRGASEGCRMACASGASVHPATRLDTMVSRAMIAPTIGSPAFTMRPRTSQRSFANTVSLLHNVGSTDAPRCSVACLGALTSSQSAETRRRRVFIPGVGFSRDNVKGRVIGGEVASRASHDRGPRSELT